MNTELARAREIALNLSLDEVLTATRSVRKRLDFQRPVPRQVLLECLELAPKASRTQAWQWVLVDDPDKKTALGAHQRPEIFAAARRSRKRHHSEPTSTREKEPELGFCSED
jgi:nitroreductase